MSELLNSSEFIKTVSEATLENRHLNAATIEHLHKPETLKKDQ
jgi:hypothetical protein